MNVNMPSPAFVLEEKLLEENLQLLNRVQKDAGVEIILAFKGFAMWSQFKLVKQYLSGATASSLNEARLCYEEMGCRSHTYCVAYDEMEFDEIVAMSSYLSFNSIGQFERFGERVPGDVKVGLRVNPEWSDVEIDLYNPSSPVSRLGVTREKMPSVLPKGITGLHFHVLCESSAESLSDVLDQLELRFSEYLKEVEWVNMGGGHLMTRDGYDLDLLIARLKDFKEKYDVQVILEPGGAVAWQTGYLKTTVLDLVENGGLKTAIIDASFTCHMPDCLEMPYRPIIRDAHENPEGKPFRYRIGGVSCLAGDFLEEYGFDQDLKVGDQLIFEDMIHYTMVKTSTFNGVKHPTICVTRTDGQFDVLRQFGYEDFKNRLS
ncbi:MAG: carboxynorspermidine decarboxylase [Cyclobacteriaceae bacterium]